MSVVRLTHFTDPHLYGGESEALRGVATLPALRAAIAHAQAREWPPDAVLVTGDLVQDDPAGYPHFRRLFGALGLPVLCLPGNHDEPRALRRELSGAPFVLGGHVDIGRWRIVLLDSCLPGSASGALSAQALAQLDEALATAAGRHCLVCLHHHPVPMASRWLDRVGLTNAADAQFLPHSDEFAVDRRPPGYRTLELRADGSLLTEVIWVEQHCGGSSRSAYSAA
jgi:Icc protein